MQAFETIFGNLQIFLYVLRKLLKFLPVARRNANTNRNQTMKTTYGDKIDRIISTYDGIALCVIGCQIVHIHVSNNIR